jgi:hypothetical protein
MNHLILGLVLACALSPRAWAQETPEGVVSIKKRASAWSFKVAPEGRKKIMINGKEVETDDPQRLYVAWAVDGPYPPQNPAVSGATFTFTSDSRVIHFFREGKQYADLKEDSSTLLARTGEELSDLQHRLVEEFYQFDLDFAGGSWEELAQLLRDRLVVAYQEQFPPILKPFLPAKVEIEISANQGVHARYPAIKAKAITLALLRASGPRALIGGKAEYVPRMVESVQGEKKGQELIMEVHESLGRLVLSDGNATQVTAGEIAFYYLGSKPGLPAADHVVALFEMAWKAQEGPLFAKVKYHPETQTLMVQGTSEEIQAADRAFATLTGRPIPVEPTGNPFDALNQHLSKIAELLEKQAAEKQKK